MFIAIQKKMIQSQFKSHLIEWLNRHNDFQDDFCVRQRKRLRYNSGKAWKIIVLLTLGTATEQFTCNNNTRSEWNLLIKDHQRKPSLADLIGADFRTAVCCGNLAKQEE